MTYPISILSPTGTLGLDGDTIRISGGLVRAVYSVPVGGAVLWFGGSVPVGWLACDGSDVSRSVYADLFAAIGTAYGVGNGTTTFGLPNESGYIVRT